MVIYSAYTQQLIVDEPWEAEDLPSSYNQKDTINNLKFKNNENEKINVHDCDDRFICHLNP